MAKKQAKKETLPAPRARSGPAPTKLFKELRDLIQTTRAGVAQAVNSALVLLYWQVGKRIRTEILESRRAAYGEEIVSTLSRQLSEEFGNGYSRPNLFRMVRFAEFFPDGEIVSTLSRQLGWSHFVEILQLKDPLQRDFYAEMCRIERWSVRTLRKKIGGMLFERTALSRKPKLLFQSAPGAEAGGNCGPEADRPPAAGFHPPPALSPGETGEPGGGTGASTMFQSAPGAEAGGNSRPPKIESGRRFQSAPGAEAGGNLGQPTITVQRYSFNPPPALRPGETASLDQGPHLGHVSIRPRR